METTRHEELNRKMLEQHDEIRRLEDIKLKAVKECNEGIKNARAKIIETINEIRTGIIQEELPNISVSPTIDKQ